MRTHKISCIHVQVNSKAVRYTMQARDLEIVDNVSILYGYTYLSTHIIIIIIVTYSSVGLSGALMVTLHTVKRKKSTFVYNSSSQLTSLASGKVCHLHCWRWQCVWSGLADHASSRPSICRRLSTEPQAAWPFHGLREKPPHKICTLQFLPCVATLWIYTTLSSQG